MIDSLVTAVIFGVAFGLGWASGIDSLVTAVIFGVAFGLGWAFSNWLGERLRARSHKRWEERHGRK